MSEEKVKGGVFYTDGGARPNPGDAGWGIHGYLYHVGVEVKNPGKYNAPTNKGYVEIYNGPKDGKPVRIINYVDGFGSLFNVTNNVAELEACKRCFLFIKEQELKEVTMLLDSDYVLQGLTDFYPKWKTNNWLTSQGKPVANLEIWHELRQLYEELDASIKLEMKWNKGHIGLLGNTRADELATKGVFAAFNGQSFEEMKISEVAGYLSTKVEFNPLFTKNRWYFISGRNEPETLPDGRYLYYTGYHGKPPSKKGNGIEEDDEDIDFTPPDSINWGVAQPDSYIGLVVVKQRESVIDKMQAYHNERCDVELEKLVCGQLSSVLNSKTYEELNEYGGLFLKKNPVHNQIDLPDGNYITWEVRPQRRSYTVHETFNHLRSLLFRYLDGGFSRTDISDLIYETKEKGKKKTTFQYKVRDSIPNSVKYLDVDVLVANKAGVETSHPLRLSLNIDMPVRAHLQRLTKESTVKPKVEVITWRESDDAFRYAVVLTVEEELLFWVATDRNLRLFRKA